jgi:hypothetical protein
MTAFLTFGGAPNNGAQPGGVGANVYETITVNFLGQDNTTLTSVVNPTVRVENEAGVKTNLQSLNLPISGQPGYFMPTPVAAGQYNFSFSTSNFDAGLYDFISTGKLPNGHTITLKGQFIISYVSKTQMFIGRLRKRLFDIDPNLYLLDEPRLMFSDDLLLKYLSSCVAD